MRRIVLASHGELAKGMIDSVSFICGSYVKEMLHAECLQAAEDANQLFIKYEKEIEENPNDNFVFITDIFGGSVNTAFMQTLAYPNVELISGMTMSIVIEVVLNQCDGKIGRETMERVLKEAKVSINYYDSLPNTSELNHDF